MAWSNQTRSGCLNRFPLKGSFKVDVNTGIGIDIDMDIDSDIAASVSLGVF